MQQARTKKFATGYAAPATKTAVLKKLPAVAANPAPVTNDLDHFAIDESGNRFAGRHVIMDVMEASPAALSDADHIRSMLKTAAEEAGATLLGMDIHHFPGGGVTGVAILAESHISIHTWPERGFAAIDVFMCGEALPGKCVPVVRRYLSPKFVQLTELKRGCLFDAAESN